MNNRFNVLDAVREILVNREKIDINCLYTSQLNLPVQLELQGSRSKFQQILNHLLRNAYQSYTTAARSQIVLLVAVINDKQQIVISVTDGGSGLSWVEKKWLENFNLRLGEKQQYHHLQEAAYSLKVDFTARLQLISAKQRGTTVRCIFNL